MSFNFEKLKNKQEEGGAMWASYSDLFMVLSFVFLLLYVVSSLRSGTFSIQKHIQYKKMAHESADLKKQIQVYEALKDDYLQKQAAQEEKVVYEELMDKLTLLKEETAEERNSLKRKFEENEKKEKALNQYQQLVRNIINTNMLQKSRLNQKQKVIAKKTDVIKKQDIELNEKTIEIAKNEETIRTQEQDIQNKAQLITQKENIIVEKQKILEEKQIEIKDLKDDIEVKKKKIETNNRLVGKIQDSLKKQIDALRKSKKQAKISQKNYKKKLDALVADAQSKIDKIEDKNKTYAQQLQQVNSELTKATTQIQNATEIISLQESERQALQVQLAQKENEMKASQATFEQEIAAKESEIKATQETFQQQIAALQEQNQSNLDAERKAFEENLKKEKLSGLEKAKKLAAFQSKAKEKEKEMAGKIAELTDAKFSAEEKAEKLARLKQKAEDAKEQMGREIASLSGDLKKAKEIIDAKKKLTEQIKKSLKDVGVDAEVDAKSGNVLISFGEDYFDTGDSNLKPGMEKILQKFMPKYSESLFKDDKISSKIKSVDIIGFASPTYQGRYVDPNSLDPKDRKAAQYNLDLSYKRARSIFKYIFDTNKLKYERQKQLLPLVKVSGSGFFAEGSKEAKEAQGMDQKQFCNKFDCKKSQKVIIKFNMDN